MIERRNRALGWLCLCYPCMPPAFVCGVQVCQGETLYVAPLILFYGLLLYSLALCARHAQPGHWAFGCAGFGALIHVGAATNMVLHNRSGNVEACLLGSIFAVSFLVGLGGALVAASQSRKVLGAGLLTTSGLVVWSSVGYHPPLTILDFFCWPFFCRPFCSGAAANPRRTLSRDRASLLKQIEPNQGEGRRGIMDFQRIALAVLALGVLGGDAWQDFYGWQHNLLSPAQLFSAAVRTLLLLATVVALVKPTRPMVLLSVIALALALLRRSLFLAPMLSVLDPSGPYLAIFHSGLDVAFRLALLGWAVNWLRRP